MYNVLKPLIFSFLLLPQGILAAALPDPIFKTTPPETKSVVEERVYFFTVRKYEPPVFIKPLANPSQASFDSPENAVIAHISAMVSSDYNWWFSTWSTESREILAERDKRHGRSPEFWEQAWQKALNQRTIQLTERVETGEYVIFEFKFISEREPKAKDITLTLAVKQFAQGWMGTQELKSDPVFLGWKHPERRLRFIIREK